MTNTNHPQPVLVANLTAKDNDSAFIAFASPERRCLGIAQKFAGYAPKRVYLLHIDDEPNEDRLRNVAEFHRLVGGAAPVQEIPVRHGDVIFGVDSLVMAVAQACDAAGCITIDISTFPKVSLLLVLRALTRLALVKRIKVLYTEPAAYETWLYEPASYGVRRVAVVPTFAASYQPNQDLVLVVFLGYERDRTLGMWQSIEPNHTIAVIGKPAYHPEWEGRVEALNAALLAGLDDKAVLYVDPRNPIASYNLLKAIVRSRQGNPANLYVAPLGTKPQTLGLHYFCNEFPDAATVAYASPLEPNAQYMSCGVGPTWLLPTPEGHK